MYTHMYCLYVRINVGACHFDNCISKAWQQCQPIHFPISLRCPHVRVFAYNMDASRGISTQHLHLLAVCFTLSCFLTLALTVAHRLQAFCSQNLLCVQIGVRCLKETRELQNRFGCISQQLYTRSLFHLSSWGISFQLLYIFFKVKD